LVSAICEVTSAPILVHGYDHPIPDGRKLGIPFGPGPWLKPVFDCADIVPDLSVRRQVMQVLIDELNKMLRDIESVFPGRVHHLGFAGAFQTQPGFQEDYRTYWANELHPNQRGFQVLANIVYKKLLSLGLQ